VQTLYDVSIDDADVTLEDADAELIAATPPACPL
jgi:hypothetical protein